MEKLDLFVRRLLGHRCKFSCSANVAAYGRSGAPATEYNGGLACRLLARSAKVTNSTLPSCFGPLGRCAACCPAKGRCRVPASPPWRTQPSVAVLRCCRDDWYCVQLDGMDLRIRVRRQEAERVGRNLAFLNLSHRCSVCSHAGREGERPFLVEGGPDRLPGTARRQVILRRAGEGSQTTGIPGPSRLQTGVCPLPGPSNSKAARSLPARPCQSRLYI